MKLPPMAYLALGPSLPCSQGHFLYFCIGHQELAQTFTGANEIKIIDPSFHFMGDHMSRVAWKNPDLYLRPGIVTNDPPLSLSHIHTLKHFNLNGKSFNHHQV